MYTYNMYPPPQRTRDAAAPPDPVLEGPLPYMLRPGLFHSHFGAGIEGIKLNGEEFCCQLLLIL